MKKFLILVPLFAAFQASASDSLIAKDVITIKQNTRETAISVSFGACQLTHDSRGYDRFIRKESSFTVNEIISIGSRPDSLTDIVQQINKAPSVANKIAVSDLKGSQNSFPSSTAWKELSGILLNKYGIVTQEKEWPKHNEYSISISPRGSSQTYEILCKNPNKFMSNSDILTLFVNSPLTVSRDF